MKRSLVVEELIDSSLTELSLLAKRLCPDARIEATTEAFEDEDSHPKLSLKPKPVPNVSVVPLRSV
jgi:hypothetical protein